MSQNPDEYGWSGDCCDETVLTKFTVGGSVFRVNKRARASLEAFVTRFDREVERVALDGWDGGWACRDVRQRKGVKSIHSWGLAIDLNASRHPLGKRGTFTRTQLAALRRLLKDFPEIAWGGDYKNRGDEQHFQICHDPAFVAAQVARRAKPTAPTAKPTPAPAKHPFPLPKGHWYGQESPDARNHSGLNPHDADDIKLIRNRLKHPGSGRYDQVLADAVHAWTRDHMAKGTRIVDATVWRALGL